MKAYLQGVSSWLPAATQTNEELARDIPGWSAERITQKTGIVGRRVAAAGETAGDLCFHAAEELFARHPEWRSQVDAIIVCTQSPDYFLPSTACLLQERLKLSTDCAAFDLTLGCSGYTYGLWLARSLIVSESARCVLLLAGDTYTRYCNPQLPATASLFGDGATASLITTEPEYAWAEIGKSIVGTDGRGADSLIVKAGGSRFPEPVDPNDRYLFMNGAEVASFAVSTVRRIVTQLLSATQLDWPDIDHFVFHQANPAFVQRLAAAYKLPIEKVPIGLADVGNTCSATIPMMLVQEHERHRFQPGQRVMLVGFGVGYSWGATLLDWLPTASTTPAQ